MSLAHKNSYTVYVTKNSCMQHATSCMKSCIVYVGLNVVGAGQIEGSMHMGGSE